MRYRLGCRGLVYVDSTLVERWQCVPILDAHLQPPQPLKLYQLDLFNTY